jgi:hypothetical protein
MQFGVNGTGEAYLVDKLVGAVGIENTNERI